MISIKVCKSKLLKHQISISLLGEESLYISYDGSLVMEGWRDKKNNVIDYEYTFDNWYQMKIFGDEFL